MEGMAFLPCPYHEPRKSDAGNTLEINGLTGHFLCHKCGMTGAVKPLAHGGRYIALVPDKRN